MTWSDGERIEGYSSLLWVLATAGVSSLGLDALRATLPYDDRGANQWTETWADSAAAMARITLQRPVRMLVHADQMLNLAPAR